MNNIDKYFDVKDDFNRKYVSDEEFFISLICLKNLTENIEQLMAELKPYLPIEKNI